MKKLNGLKHDYVYLRVDIVWDLDSLKGEVDPDKYLEELGLPSKVFIKILKETYANPNVELNLSEKLENLFSHSIDDLMVDEVGENASDDWLTWTEDELVDGDVVGIRYDEGFMSNIGKDGQHLYSIIYKFDGWDDSVQEYGKTEEDAIRRAIAKGSIDYDDEIVKVVDLGEKGEYLESSRKLVREYADGTEALSDDYRVELSDDDRYELYLDLCKRWGDKPMSYNQWKKEQSQEPRGGWYGESKKLVKEGAGAGYTVRIKDLKFGNIIDKKLIKGKERYDDYYECQVEILPGEYEIGAEDYYNDFFWEIHKYTDEEPTAKIDGGVATIAYSTNSYDEDEAEEELRQEVAGRTMDIAFGYGWGWVHADLPKDKPIESDHVDVEGTAFYGSIDKIELNAPDLADAVNGGHQSIYDRDEEDEEYDESTKKVVKESSEDFERFFETLKFKFRKDGCSVKLRDNEDGTEVIEVSAPNSGDDGELFDFIKRKCESNHWFFEREYGRLITTYFIREDEDEELVDESYDYDKDDGRVKVMDALEEFRQVLWDDTVAGDEEEHDLRKTWFLKADRDISNAIQIYFKYTRI